MKNERNSRLNPLTKGSRGKEGDESHNVTVNRGHKPYHEPLSKGHKSGNDTRQWAIDHMMTCLHIP